MEQLWQSLLTHLFQRSCHSRITALERPWQQPWNCCDNSCGTTVTTAYHSLSTVEQRFRLTALLSYLYNRLPWLPIVHNTRWLQLLVFTLVVDHPKWARIQLSIIEITLKIVILGIKMKVFSNISDYLSAFCFCQSFVYQCFNAKMTVTAIFQHFTCVRVRARENSCCQNGVNLTIVSDEVVGQKNISI